MKVSILWKIILFRVFFQRCSVCFTNFFETSPRIHSRDISQGSFVAPTFSNKLGRYTWVNGFTNLKFIEFPRCDVYTVFRFHSSCVGSLCFILISFIYESYSIFVGSSHSSIKEPVHPTSPDQLVHWNAVWCIWKKIHCAKLLELRIFIFENPDLILNKLDSGLSTSAERLIGFQVHLPWICKILIEGFSWLHNKTDPVPDCLPSPQ